MKNKISAVVCTYQEEKNISRLIKSLNGCDEIIIADGGSIDKTVKIAKEMGVKVIIRNDKKDIPSKQDIKSFKIKFGYFPLFTTESRLINMGEMRNKALTYAKYDWVFFPDADEVVEWNLTEVKKLFNYDQIECNLIQTDGLTNRITKLFNRHKSKWGGRSHEVVCGSPKRIFTDKMKIIHYYIEKGGNVCPNLEYEILKKDSIRAMFYLGMEYYYHRMFVRAVKMLNYYLKYAKWLPEIAEAHYFKALSLWNLFEIEKAKTSCLKAIQINANMKKALELMSELCWERNAVKWNEFAQLATNEDVIFKK